MDKKDQAKEYLKAAINAGSSKLQLYAIDNAINAIIEATKEEQSEKIADLQQQISVVTQTVGALSRNTLETFQAYNSLLEKMANTIADLAKGPRPVDTAGVRQETLDQLQALHNAGILDKDQVTAAGVRLADQLREIMNPPGCPHCGNQGEHYCPGPLQPGAQRREDEKRYDYRFECVGQADPFCNCPTCR